MEKNKKVYIVIVNYRGWLDTIECIESIIKNDYKNYQIILVDNNSPDNSEKFLKVWLEGNYNIWLHPSNFFKLYSFPPFNASIPYKFYSKIESESLLNENIETNVNNQIINNPIIFIQSGDNLGFAGGNNIGIRYALSKNDFEYIWFLNNDTVIEKNTLSILIEEFDQINKNKEKIGILGSKLIYYSEPNIINCIGGKYNSKLGTIKSIGMYEVDKGQYDKPINDLDYIMGASMLVKKDFINDVGLMSEDYFLYFEELDWAERGKKNGWKNGYCWKSRVFHKEGKSIGSNKDGKKRSQLADNLQLKNRIVFTRKFYKKYLVFIYLGFLVVIFNRIRRGQINQVKNVIKILLTT